MSADIPNPPVQTTPVPRSSYLGFISEDNVATTTGFVKMDDADPGGLKMKSKSTPEVDALAAAKDDTLKPPPANARFTSDAETPEETDYLSAGGSSTNGLSTPSTPGTGLSRTQSQSELEDYDNDAVLPPMDRLSMFDLLENFALPQRLESIQTAIHDNAEKLRRQRAALASRAVKQKNNLVGEWRKRVPPVKPEEQLDKYRKRMRENVERVNKRWNDAKTVTLKEKISFVTACLNIFLSGYLIGGWPEYFHLWYTAQLAYVVFILLGTVDGSLIEMQILHAGAMVHLPQDWLPLLPGGSMLLRQSAAHAIDMVFSAVEAPLHLDVLPCIRQQRGRDCYVEEQSGLPQLG